MCRCLDKINMRNLSSMKNDESCILRRNLFFLRIFTYVLFTNATKNQKVIVSDSFHAHKNSYLPINMDENQMIYNYIFHFYHILK